jgi:putative tricarboxylic transport membrane protein
MLISRGDVSVFVTRPVSAGLLALALLLLVVALLPVVRRRRQQVFVE